MGTSEIGMLALGVVFGAAVSAPIVLLWSKGKATSETDALRTETLDLRAKLTSQESLLTAEREARAKEAESARKEGERFEEKRSSLEDQLQQYRATAASSDATAKAATESLTAVEAARDAAKNELAEVSRTASKLELDLAAAMTRASTAEDAKVVALSAKDEECQKLLESERKASKEREQGLRDGHEAALMALKKANEAQVAAHQAAMISLREAHEKAESAMRQAHGRELASRDGQIADQKAYIEKCDEALGKAFKDATATALGEALKGFDERAQARFKEEQERAGERSRLEKEEIERLLKPMHEEIKGLEELNTRLEESRVKAEGALDEKLQRIQQTSESLANALRKPGVRGTWGEEQLKRILDSAGMTEGVHYRVQDHTEEEGEALRTDFIIMLPKGREVVIDSKAPFAQYEAAMNATTEEERVRYSEAHAKAVRGHFKALKSKEYWRRYPGSPDCVFLFIPHEGAYQLACEYDKQLLSDCHAQKVILANPMTLMSLVHVAAYALQEDRMKGDMEQVRNAAVTLCERLGRVFTLITKHRGHLASAVDSYNGVVASIEGRLIPSTKTMERLGLGDAKLANAPNVLQANIRILPVAEVDEDLGKSEVLVNPQLLGDVTEPLSSDQDVLALTSTSSVLEPDLVG
ncbi:DNA recombination protein RmuC [bacterium]|nr:MAG: DNA recombination protein RmuC [bacterium]